MNRELSAIEAIQDAADCLGSISNSLDFMARGIRPIDSGAFFLLLDIGNNVEELEDRLRETLKEMGRTADLGHI